MCQNLIPFYGCMLFHCINRPHCWFPFIHWWPFGWFPLRGSHIYYFNHLDQAVGQGGIKTGICSFSLWVLTPLYGLLFSWTYSGFFLLSRGPPNGQTQRRSTVDGSQWDPVTYLNSVWLVGLPPAENLQTLTLHPDLIAWWQPPLVAQW